MDAPFPTEDELRLRHLLFEVMPAVQKEDARKVLDAINEQITRMRD